LIIDVVPLSTLQPYQYAQDGPRRAANWIMSSGPEVDLKMSQVEHPASWKQRRSKKEKNITTAGFVVPELFRTTTTQVFRQLFARTGIAAAVRAEKEQNA
jgi:hypothetical protein